MFKMVSLDSSEYISSHEIPSNHPIIFIYFSPDCEHCQNEVKWILKDSEKLIKSNIYLVANEPFSELRKFYVNNNLEKERNIRVVKDYEYSFYRKFLPATTPFIAIYNTKKELIKLYTGETSVKSLIYSIQ